MQTGAEPQAQSTKQEITLQGSHWGEIDWDKDANTNLQGNENTVVGTGRNNLCAHWGWFTIKDPYRKGEPVYSRDRIPQGLQRLGNIAFDSCPPFARF